jgi:hypothetical protein
MQEKVIKTQAVKDYFKAHPEAWNKEVVDAPLPARSNAGNTMTTGDQRPE